MSSLQKILDIQYVKMENDHVADILEIERDSYGYPWSEKIFLDCNFIQKALEQKKGKLF